MATTCIEFGYYPSKLDVSFGTLKIETLPSIVEKFETIKSSNLIEREWLYAPQYTNHPYTSRIFELPKTHKFVGEGSGREEELHFFVWILSFFVGMRFSYGDMGFLDSTPIVQGKLVDFILGHQAIEKACDEAADFWSVHAANKKNIQLMIAALNSLYLAQHPKNLQFEEFNYLYFSLDACFKLTSVIHGPMPNSVLSHAKRVEWTCQKLGTLTPAWATGNPTTISELRNATMHEGLFANKPLGFGVLKSAAKPPSGNLCLEMKKLVCRFLVSLILRSRPDYVSSNVDDRMCHLLVI